MRGPCLVLLLAAAATEKPKKQAPSVERIAWSAYRCTYWLYHKKAEEEVAEEMKYADEGAGIVDANRMYSMQLVMRRTDMRMARADAELKPRRGLDNHDRPHNLGLDRAA